MTARKAGCLPIKTQEFRGLSRTATQTAPTEESFQGRFTFVVPIRKVNRMTATALASDIGVGRTTLWRWTRAGLLPEPQRDGRVAIYSPAAVRMARALAEVAR